MQNNAREIKLRRGYDLPFTGVADERIERGPPVRPVAALGTDYAGMRPSLRVSEGDRVTLGDTLFVDRKREEMGEEMFGPVLHIVRFASRDLDRVIDDINAATVQVLNLVVGNRSKVDLQNIPAE